MQSPLSEPDTFDSVQWDTIPNNPSSIPGSPEHPNPAALFSGGGEPSSSREEGAGPSTSGGGGEGSSWDGWMDVRIVDYKKELENGKESYVSFGVETKVSSGVLWREGEGEGGRRWRWIGRWDELDHLLPLLLPWCLRHNLAMQSRRSWKLSSLRIVYQSKGTKLSRADLVLLPSLPSRTSQPSTLRTSKSVVDSKISSSFTTTWPRTSRPASFLPSQTSTDSVSPASLFPQASLHCGGGADFPPTPLLSLQQSTCLEGIDLELSSWRRGSKSESCSIATRREEQNKEGRRGA